MRKSISTRRSRFIRAGVAAGAVTAALLAVTAAPALAVGAVAIVDTGGPTGGGEVITATSSAQFNATTNTATFSSGTTCPVSSAGSATNLVSPLVATTSSSSIDITVPATVVAPVAYKVCVYNGATLVNSPNNLPIYTVTPATSVLSPTSGPTGAATSITATLTGFLTATSAPATVFSTAASCPTTYGTPTANLVATTVRTTADVATITQPAGVATPNVYKVCIYGGSLSGSNLIAIGAAYTPGPPVAALNPVSGLTGGGNTITATSTLPILNGVSSPGVIFSASTCATTYGSPTANLVGTGVSKASDTLLSIGVPTGVVYPSTYSACIYDGSVSGSALLGVSTAVYTPMLPVLDLPITTGKVGGGNTITGQAPNNLFTSIPTPGVIFRGDGACPALYNATSTSANLTAVATRIAVNRLALTVPNVITTTPGPDYKVCVYSGTAGGTSPLIATAPKYTAAAATSILSVAPTAGPSGGKSLITVTGTGFPTISSGGSITAASIGGAPLTDITLSNSDPTYFTAKTPGHAPGANLTLSITTSAGDFTLKNAFTYTNGIVATPNTAPNESTTLSTYVVGVGYSAMTFDGSLSKAHVYMVDGKYDASPMAGNAALKANGPVTECTAVLPISDTELICTLQMTQRLGANGLPIGDLRSVSDAATLTDTSLTSATAHFTQADVGLTVTQTGGTAAVGAGTYILSVVDDDEVVLSQATTDTQTVTVSIGGSSRSVGTITTATGSTTLTGAAGKFVATDVGRPITGTGIPANTIINAVTPTGNGATLSRAATAPGTVTVAVSPAAQIPDGTYTMTVVTNGDLNAAATDPDYSQSIITSGSTFTVADY